LMMIGIEDLRDAFRIGERPNVPGGYSYYGKTGANAVIARESTFQRPSDKSTITISAVPGASASAGRGWEGRRARIYPPKAAIPINRDDTNLHRSNVSSGNAARRRS
jgi:hypothetical protein